MRPGGQPYFDFEDEHIRELVRRPSLCQDLPPGAEEQEEFFREMFMLVMEWTAVVVSILNDEYNDGRGGCSGPPSGLQLRAVCGIVEKVVHLVGLAELRADTEDWSKRLGNFRVGYAGEVGARSQILTWAQMEPPTASPLVREDPAHRHRGGPSA
jgi:hypothetical protein